MNRLIYLSVFKLDNQINSNKKGGWIILTLITQKIICKAMYYKNKRNMTGWIINYQEDIINMCLYEKNIVSKYKKQLIVLS